MEYIQTKDFMNSLRDLHSKGGSFKKAADKIKVTLCNAGDTGYKNPLKDLSTTNHGENRIKHCIKYDLPGASRLITIQYDGLCFFCFAGDHAACDKWLDKNRGLTSVVDIKGKLTTVQVSIKTDDDRLRITGESSLNYGNLFELLADDDFDTLIEGIPRKLIRTIESFDSLSEENAIFDAVKSIEDTNKSEAIYDVFSLLRQNKCIEANKRLDLYLGRSKPIHELSVEEIASLANSESIQSLSITDPNFPKIFQHFVETANYMDWMLFMHPDQTNVVDKDFDGSAKLLGVSGSGKTCVVVKRAIRLAEQYENEKILVLTLNRPLAVLIEKMVDTACLKEVRDRIHVKPFFILCQEILHQFEPQNNKLYDDKTWKSEEHIDEVWREFYRCELNNQDASVLHQVHDSLISRNVNAEQYIREEFDWIRSALSPTNRDKYTSIQRKGRSYPMDGRFRKLVLRGLVAWENKMSAIGVTDYLGLATALYKYIDKITPSYRSILVDEAQDFGTIEYQIIRSLVSENKNDLFFCGDAAQQVSAKHQSFNDAEINIHPSRITKITKNYRNSYEILTAAEELLIANLSDEMFSSEDFEILNPEFADFTSTIPLVLKADNLEDEIAYAISFLKDFIDEDKDEKACLAICGYSLYEIQTFGNKIKIPVLDGDISIDEHNLYLSDLEQTKGFEFDAVCIINCNDEVIPNPLQPIKEQFRDLSRFYVAMTRAKMQLVISYSEKRSSFITKDKVNSSFQEDQWSAYNTDNTLKVCGKPPTLKEIRLDAEVNEEFKEAFDMSGPEVLYTRDAIGLSSLLIEKLRILIPGKTTRITGGVRIKWKTIRDAEKDINENPRSRGSFGPEGLPLFKSFLSSIKIKYK